MWDEKGTHCRYNFPHDGKVNNYQATQWISEFCQKYDYKIVVTSTWRLDENYKECLRRGGLRDSVEILDRTPHLHGKRRGDEIKAWLDEHPDVERYIIVDDENNILDEQREYFLQTDTLVGFTMANMIRCEGIHTGTKGPTRILVDRLRDELCNIPDNKVANADVIISDLILGTAESLLQGFAKEIVDLWLQSQDKYHLEQLFALFTGTEFDTFLCQCLRSDAVTKG